MTEGQEQWDPRVMAKYIAAYQNNENNFMKYQIDSSGELTMLRRSLLGLDYDEETGKWEKVDFKEQLLNEKGADFILTFMRLRLSKVTSLSDLDDEDIRSRCKWFAIDLTFSLVRHKDEYDVKSLQVLSSIIGLCDDLFFTTLKKARNAGERDSLRKQYLHQETTEHITQTQRKPDNRLFQNPLATSRY